MAKSLHEIAGDLVEETISPQCTVYRSPECGGKHIVPLHFSAGGTNETEFCEVDLAVVKNGEVRVIIEIEESNVKPVQVFGKVLASAMSSYYIHGEQAIRFPIATSVHFVQILDTSNLKLERTSKTGQWELVEESIQKILQSVETRVADYELIVGDSADFEAGEERNRFRKALNRALG